eukprot:4720734-Pyramimonas_sp.AAC.1
MAGLQGFNYSELNLDGISNSQFGKMLGNSFSVNVMERVLIRSLIAVGIINQPVFDKWQDDFVTPKKAKKGYTIPPCMFPF